jgi:hypothetical protein
LVARLESGSWKLAPGVAFDAKRSAERLAAVKRATKEVQSGAHKDRQAAMIALSNAWAKKGGSTR